NVDGARRFARWRSELELHHGKTGVVLERQRRVRRLVAREAQKSRIAGEARDMVRRLVEHKCGVHYASTGRARRGPRPFSLPRAIERNDALSTRRGELVARIEA